MPPLLCTRPVADGAALCLEAQPPTRLTLLTREDAPFHEKTTVIQWQGGPQEETGLGMAPIRAHATALAQEGLSPTELPLTAYTNKPTPSLFYLTKQTRPCAFAYRIPPLPLCHLPPTGHLRTCRSSASPKFTQSSSEASSPSHSSIRNSSALRECWCICSSISSAASLLVSGSRSSVVCYGVRIRIRVDSGYERTPSACFAIRTCYCR